MTINALVNEMILKHEGGELFFDNLDKNLCNKNYMSLIFKKACEEYDNFTPISSGTFGLYFSNYLFNSGLFSINVNGGLRKGKKIISLEPFGNKIQDQLFIFFDDSFYLGRTRNAVQEELHKYGGKLIATYVCYDGSKEKDSTVHSLYRYYDNH